MYEFVPLIVMVAFFAALIVPDRSLRADARAVFDATISMILPTCAARRLLGGRGSTAEA
ncbi:hypothetical protein [Tropicimonas sediminicola]|uniref:Uncharacterized protein n=1 Tax=Tropicimonas sediminicola TaxID=1031541 RepID=A0A239LBS1_9RHOB|nr:hypothetical protein [Tropicimonas sediminicola]SNT27921.1 hypothetical protein SAMN05421757_109118 [Tropicimonas sediminicola]